MSANDVVSGEVVIYLFLMVPRDCKSLFGVLIAGLIH